MLIDRQSSILEFNRRVLAQARRSDVPILERLRYVTIVSSNVDEFFEVRFPELLEALREADTPAVRNAFVQTSSLARSLIDEQYQVFNDEVMPGLAGWGFRILNHSERNEEQRRWVASFYEAQVRPLLVPVALDPAHPFPLVANKSLNFILRVAADQSPLTRGSIVIVKVPRSLPRVIPLPPKLMPRGQQGFVLLTSVIRAHLNDLLPGTQVQAFSQFRVTRDVDLELEEEDVADLRQALRSGLTRRQFGKAIRLEVVQSCPKELSAFLLEQFELPAEALYAVNGPVNLVRLGQLIDQADHRLARFVPFTPGWPSACVKGRSIFDCLKSSDILLHHPFESFEPVVEFLRQAVFDPDVLAIKQTVYRTGSESVLMELLLEAVRRGKEVTVVVELKARFDEEANINWADRLESVGAQVVYGKVGLKTHAKMLLVTRREYGKKSGPILRRYAHLSTGNYNPKTAKLYTDVGLLTASETLTADVDAVFLNISSLAGIPPLRKLLTAPDRLHPRMLELTAEVAVAARRGHVGRIVLKVNALTDPELIEGLLEASRAGAKIDLIVRGACALRPGVEDYSRNVRVISVIGRFLEHSRVFYFRWEGPSAQEHLYLSSADWMTRNMLRRVEVAWPIEDPTCRQRVIDECLVPYLHDGLDSWEMNSQGKYQRLDRGGPCAQTALIALHSQATP